MSEAAPPEGKRRLLWWLLAPLVLEVLYLVGANGLLMSERGQQLLNRRPEKLEIRYESAFTLLPGWVIVEQLELSGRARRARWQIDVRQGHLWIWLPSLVNRHFRLLRAPAEGVRLVVLPQPPPETPRPERKRRGFRTTLAGVSIQSLDEVQFGELTLQGEGRLAGEATFEARGPMAFDLSELLFPEAQLLSGDQVVVDDFLVDASLALDDMVMGEASVEGFLASVSGHLALDGQTQSLGFLASYFSKFPWLEMTGSGHLVCDLEVARGWLAPGSEIRLDGSTLDAVFLGLAARGEGQLRAWVPVDEGHTRIELALDHYSVNRVSDDASLLNGAALVMQLMNDSTAIDRPAEGLVVDVSLPTATVSDLAAFSTYLPSSTGLALTGGAAEVAAQLRYDATLDDGSGWLRWDGNAVEAKYQELDLLADVALNVSFSDFEVQGGRVNLGGSSLDLTNVRLARAKSSTGAWWGKLQVPQGLIDGRLFGEDEPLPRVSGKLEAELLDSSPLTTLIERRAGRLAWFDGLLTVEDVEVKSDFSVHGQSLSLNNLALGGGAHGRLEMLAELEMTHRQPEGLFFARWGKLSAAVRLDDDGRDWKLTRSRKWFEREKKRSQSDSRPTDTGPASKR